VAKGEGDRRTAKKVSVNLGGEDGQRIVVESGLRPGDQVIYAGQKYLNEGDALSLTEWTAQGPRTLPEGSGQVASCPTWIGATWAHEKE
jgi:hypothetical protein